MSHLSSGKTYPHRSTALVRNRRSHPDRRRSTIVLILLLLVWSICLGMGMAQATQSPPFSTASSDSIAQATPSGNAANPNTIGTVDVVPPPFQKGEKLYLENCSTCHIGIPPAVLPSQTWAELIQDPQHYGVTIQPPGLLEISALWKYLQQYSRPLAKGEPTPYRIYQSGIFKTLHPRVKLPTKVTLEGCVSCHPGAKAYDFRSLSAEWQNAP